ncbi:MAG: type II toxin-antitoxin system Phd/YefM family antitoxin [Magnetococcales bacterium]|nr:type II toxin-antitoxin system Phd/YefM family antitoxin [Magnetococcales bacterium]
MERVFAEFTTSLTNLKRNPSRVIEEAGGAPVAILSHNKPKAYLISPETYRELLEAQEDLELARVVEQRAGDDDKFVPVTLDEL